VLVVALLVQNFPALYIMWSFITASKQPAAFRPYTMKVSFILRAQICGFLVLLLYGNDDRANGRNVVFYQCCKEMQLTKIHL
jgi:hypothetical protein